ncbi:MAG: hypothetical protein HONBIEJF_00130 [Fimbriimonadaceae bacterium]|nr:hypothetical protein [Fimbriimonadaceae bacterium]
MNLTLREIDFEKDLETYRRLRSLGETEPISEEYLRDSEKRFPATSKRLRLLAEVDGNPAGLAFWIAHQQYKQGMIWGQILVEPEFRGRGIGRALWSGATTRAKQLSFTRVWGECREDDPTSIRFAESVGGEKIAHIFESILDIDALPDRTAGLEPSGIQLCDYRDLPDTEETRRENL